MSLSSTIYAQENSSSELIPIGWDAYKMWNKWPMQRIGVRAYMRSTYDRSGGNESANVSHFLYMCEEDNNITLDITGKGYLFFIRINHWHGSPWRYTVDGNSCIVKKTATQKSVGAKHFFDRTAFIPQNSFKEPLTYTWSTTKGSNLVWVLIGFNNSIRLVYGRLNLVKYNNT